MGTFVLPVIHANECVGVLQFVLDTPKDSYDGEIGVVDTALQHAGFQSSFLFQTNDLPTRTYIDGQERERCTSSSVYANYDCLQKYFGLSTAKVMDKLVAKAGAFGRACRFSAIPEWPYIPTRTIVSVSSDPETQLNLTTFETSSFATEVMPNWNMRTLERLCVQTMTTQAPLSDCLINQMIACNDTSSCGTPMASSEFMESEFSSFGIPTATDQLSNISSWNPMWDVGMPYRQSMATTEACLSENSIDQIPQDASSFEAPMGSFEYSADSEYMAFDTSFFGAPECMESEFSSFGIQPATDHMFNVSSLIPSGDVGMPYTQSMATTEACLYENRFNQTAQDASCFATTYPTGGVMNTGASLPETLINQIAPVDGYMPDYDDTGYLGNMEDLDLGSFICGFFDFDK